MGGGIRWHDSAYHQGGQSWHPQIGGTDQLLTSICGAGDGKTLWVAGFDGTILHTNDRGQSWHSQISGTHNELLSIYGIGDGKTLWVVGGNATILHTGDRGQSWQPQTGGADNALFSIYGAENGKLLWAAGIRGTILHTNDGGHSWQPQTSDSDEFLWSIYGTGDGKLLWAVAGGTILHTSDGGQSWQPQSTGTNYTLDSITGTGDGKTLWAVGYGGTILHTTNGGQTWTNLRDTHPYRYRPALWTWLVLAFAIFLQAAGFHRLRGPIPEPKKTIENSGVSDTPTTTLKHDLLEATGTVLALAEFLRNRNTEPPLTISIEAKWGMGKTSVMRMLEAELCRAHVPTVWFNAWHNEGEQQMLAFLLESVRRGRISSLVESAGTALSPAPVGCPLCALALPAATAVRRLGLHRASCARMGTPPGHA